MGQTISSYLKGMGELENNSKDETIEQLRLIQQKLVTMIKTETNKMRVAATDRRLRRRACTERLGEIQKVKETRKAGENKTDKNET